MLIASRALMGVGGAFIMPSTLSILTATFPAHERAKAIGAWAAVSGLGIAIGPVAGGWIVEHAHWSWIFLVNIPFVIAALLAQRPLVPESSDPAAPRLDLRASCSPPAAWSRSCGPSSRRLRGAGPTRGSSARSLPPAP